MAEVKAPYVQPTYTLFTDTYLRTQRQRMDEALQMALMEIESQKDLLDYYQKTEKSLIDYMEKVGTASTGGKLTNKQFEQYFKAQQFETKVNQDANSNMAKVNADTRKEFLVPQGSIASINTQAAQAAINMGGGSTVDSARKGALAVGGYTPGTSAAMNSAIAYYQQLEAESVRKGTDAKFDGKRDEIADAVAQVFGVTNYSGAGNGATLIENPQGMEILKEKRKQELMSQQAKPTASATQIKDLYTKAGVNPSTTSGKGVSDTARATEDLFSKRLKSVQGKQDALEAKLAEAQTAEGLYARQTDIYNDRYNQSRKLRKQSRAIQDAMEALSPEQVYMMEALEATKGVRENPFYATPDDKGDVQQAKQLMDAMIKNAGSGRSIDVISLASKLADGDEKQTKKIMGMAFKGVMTYNAEGRPQDAIAEIQKVNEDKKVLQETQVEAQQEVAKIQTEAKQEGMHQMPDGTMMADSEMEGEGYGEGKLAFEDKPALDAFFAQRVGIPESRVNELLADFDLQPGEAARISAMTEPIETPTIEEQIKALEIGTEVKKDPTFGYGYRVERIAPNGQVQFSGTGQIKGKKMTPAMQKEADEAYRKALEAMYNTAE